MRAFKLSFIFLGAAFLAMTGCTNTATEETQNLSITSEVFGTMPDGQEVQIYTLTNNNQMQVKITNYGGIITSIEVPDKDGTIGEVVLGFDDFDSYLGEHPFFGALVGRYGNRIAGGKFTLNGEEYTLAQNNGPNHLHGGIRGFDKVLWDAQETVTEEGATLKLNYLSEDGEEGYPGNLDVTVLYTLNDNNEIVIEYIAETDKSTHVNLTNHSYFNLNHDNSENALDHIVEIKADKYTVVDEGLIPTGELRDVEGTVMDFREPKAIGKDIGAVEGNGYDHNYVLNKTGTSLELLVKVLEPETRRTLEVFTTQPGVQFYTGNFLNGSITGRNGVVYSQNFGFCVETQHFPDTPNQPSFPSTVLNPEEKYNHTTIYRFGVE